MIITHVGDMDVYRWWPFWQRIGARVLFNGQDVTNRCRWFNDITGHCELTTMDDQGRPIVSRDGDIASQLLTGCVQVDVP